MYSSLKKNGLSDTKHQLKSQLINSSASKSSRKQKLKQNQKTFATSNISKFQITSQQALVKPRLILDILIELISFKQRESCIINQHDYNPTKYICLQQSCSKRIGCSYCFLENHKLHAKVDSKICLNDLTELKEKVEDNRHKIRQILVNKREEVKDSLQKYIEKIKEEFLSSLDYLNCKIKDRIQSQFSKKISQISLYPTSNRCNKEQFISNDISFKEYKSQNQPKTNRQLQISQIISIFNSEPSSNIKFSDLNSFSQRKQPTELKKDYKQTFPIFNMTNDQEFNLLTKLSRLNLTYVEQYLRQQLLQTKQFGNYLKVFQDFYTQLGASLNELFAAFKRAMPSCKSFEINMTEPQVLSFFSL